MNKDIPIIGIGASTGGLEALEAFFGNMDEPSGFAYIVVQHLEHNHKSLMDELLARYTKLPIFIITDGMIVQAIHIYLNPPKKFVELAFYWITVILISKINYKEIKLTETINLNNSLLLI
jgi:two-component system CheB/CheR fusion protein